MAQLSLSCNTLMADAFASSDFFLRRLKCTKMQLKLRSRLLPGKQVDVKEAAWVHLCSSSRFNSLLFSEMLIRWVKYLVFYFSKWYILKVIRVKFPCADPCFLSLRNSTYSCSKYPPSCHCSSWIETHGLIDWVGNRNLPLQAKMVSSLDALQNISQLIAA